MTVTTRLRLLAPAAAIAVALVAVAGCTTAKDTASGPDGNGAGGGSSSSSTPSPTKTAAPAASLSMVPANGAASVNPAQPARVRVANGTLTSVRMTNDAGVVVKGALDATKTVWSTAEVLGYDKRYTVRVAAANADGKATTTTSSFTTVRPPNMTKPYMNTTGGGGITSGGTYGVGMVVNVHWDEPITDKAAAERTLSVTTSPKVAGSWYWVDDTNVHWRPQAYYKSGTKVTVNAKVYGKQVSPGLWGQTDVSTSFKIGASHISIADDNTKQVRVYFDGKFQRSMATSMGKGGSEVINGRTISYWTQPGTYTVLDKSNPVLMDSQTYGLPYAKGGYKEYINYATRISTDGVYLHELDSTVGAQGSYNTSHGCLNLNQDNASWFYNNAQVGDVVQVKNTGGSPLEVWQNGDWSVPWTTWVKGSALH